MTLKGHFENGVIIPDEPHDLREGQRVLVSLEPAQQVDPASPNAALIEKLRQLGPMSPEQREDWRRSMAEVMAAREEDIALEDQADRDRAVALADAKARRAS